MSYITPLDSRLTVHDTFWGDLLALYRGRETYDGANAWDARFSTLESTYKLELRIYQARDDLLRRMADLPAFPKMRRGQPPPPELKEVRRLYVEAHSQFATFREKCRAWSLACAPHVESDPPAGYRLIGEMFRMPEMQPYNRLNSCFQAMTPRAKEKRRKRDKKRYEALTEDQRQARIEAQRARRAAKRAS